MILFGNPAHGFAIAAKAQCTFNPAVDQVISREEDGALLGGVIYQDYGVASITMHVAGWTEHWINRDMLWVCFHYPLVQLGCLKVFAPIRSHNLKALEFCAKLGFTEEVRIADVYPDEDLCILSMRRDACRWLALAPRGLKEGGRSGKEV